MRPALAAISTWHRTPANTLFFDDFTGAPDGAFPDFRTPPIGGKWRATAMQIKSTWALPDFSDTKGTLYFANPKKNFDFKLTLDLLSLTDHPPTVNFYLEGGTDYVTMNVTDEIYFSGYPELLSGGGTLTSTKMPLTIECSSVTGHATVRTADSLVGVWDWGWNHLPDYYENIITGFQIILPCKRFAGDNFTNAACLKSVKLELDA